jgi:hypothetical protein
MTKAKMTADSRCCTKCWSSVRLVPRSSSSSPWRTPPPTTSKEPNPLYRAHDTHDTHNTHDTRHTAHGTRHTAHGTRHTAHGTRHTAHGTHGTHGTRHTTQDTRTPAHPNGWVLRTQGLRLVSFAELERSGASLRRSEREFQLVRRKPADLYTLMYTSGSTGVRGPSCAPVVLCDVCHALTTM